MKIKILTLMMILASVMSKVNAQCGTATNLSHNFSNLVNTFSWHSVPNAVNYQLEIAESGSYSALELLTVTTDTSFVTPGGVLSASYDWRIITTCQNGDTDTSTFAYFTLPCPTPTATSTTNITQTSSTLNWLNPYASDPMYERGVILAYRPIGGSWTPLTNFSLNNSWQLNNLTPNTTYEWCANLNCAYYDSAPVVSQFTTLGPPCGVSTSLNVLNLTNTSARLNWASVSGATGYSIQYKAVNSSNWTTSTNNTNTQLLVTGLTLNTAYHFRIATICGASQSAYSTPFTFTTNCVSLNNSAEWIDYFKLNTLLRVSGAEPNGYTYQNMPTTLVKGSTYQLKVSAGFSGQNYNQDFATYLDVNGNGTFEITERVVGVGLISNGSIRTYSLTVPTTTVTGQIKIRIVMVRQNQGFSISPCVPVASRGEIEDYDVNIVAPAQNRPSYDLDHADEGSLSSIELENRNSKVDSDPEVALSPNPNHGDFTIKSDAKITKYAIYNMNGMLVQTNRFDLGTNEIFISLENAIEGIYLVRITDCNQHVSTHKIFVKP